MNLFVWILFGLAVFAEGFRVKKTKAISADELEWPKEFRLKAKRMSLTANLFENYEIWRTSQRSRIDYNNGYVKSIVDTNKKVARYGIKYDIHPEATLDQDIQTVCKYVEGNKFEHITPETILPDADDFKIEGEDNLNGNYYTRFSNNVNMLGVYSQNTLWAIFDTDKWIPIRYEILEFNSWLGEKSKHELWDFYDYDTEISSDLVFSVDEYNCTAQDPESEAVAKHLLFMDPEKEKHVKHAFEKFKSNYKRNYFDTEEHSKREIIFKNNMRRVIEHNRQNLGYKLSINQFADKSPAERKKYMGLLTRPQGRKGNVPFPYTEDSVNDIVNDLPKEYDTRLYGYVSYVKNQDECGSCWTFGTTAAVEGALARVNGGRLLSLSNQALVDCAWAFGAKGCGGGTDVEAYEWMMQYGLPTEAEYGSYTNQDGLCRIKNMTKLYPIRGYTNVTPLSIGALKVALINHGPLSVSVHVSDAFSLYSSGIFYDPNCSQVELDHEVSLVGYGERDGDTFWILKNSWGHSWGMSGYMYISAKDNNCGVATEPTYVLF